MGAFVDHNFERGFVVGEEQLRKLWDLVNRRLSSGGGMESTLRLRVFRGDAFSYETESIQDVINEDNDKWRAITKLDLFVQSQSNLEFKLSFANGNVRLSILGEDRDAVFLLFSDLREYISGGVLASKLLTKDTARLIVLSTTLALFALTAYFVSIPFSTRAELSAALATTNLNEKLNFLLGERMRAGTSMRNMLWLMLAPLVWMILGNDLVSRGWEALFPSNVFVFGAKKTIWEKRRRLVSNLIWVVAVGSAVSIVTGLLVWKFTG